MRIPILKHLAPILVIILISSCGSVWTQSAPEKLNDGSRIQITTWKNQYRKDGVRLDREDRNAKKSFFYLKKTPQDYDDYKIVSHSKNGITLAFLGTNAEVLFTQSFPYAEFISQ